MKKYALSVVAVLSLVIAAAASLALAQIEGTIESNVPFAFYVGNTQLPAGRYEIKRVDPAMNPNLIELRSKDGKTAVLALGIPLQLSAPPEKTELVFKKYGNVAVLSQILEATGSGLELPKLLQEEQAAKGGATPEMQSVQGTSSKRPK
jgi:hypothetical protein